MNCKPQDVARIIDHRMSRLCGVVDLFVRVTTVTTMGSGQPGWLIDEPILCRCGCFGVIESVADTLLRPIRDPGEDAIDWASHRTPRSVDLREDQLTRARAQLETVS